MAEWSRSDEHRSQETLEKKSSPIHPSWQGKCFEPYGRQNWATHAHLLMRSQSCLASFWINIVSGMECCIPVDKICHCETLLVGWPLIKQAECWKVHFQLHFWRPKRALTNKATTGPEERFFFQFCSIRDAQLKWNVLQLNATLN